MRDTIIMNSLLTEILEKIIKFASKGKYISEIGRKYLLKEYVLVSRKWAVIANPLFWKEVNLYHKYNKREFSFYRHITKPEYTCGKYSLPSI
jgi:hypothetical protein